jgi:hypothetical protein
MSKISYVTVTIKRNFKIMTSNKNMSKRRSLFHATMVGQKRFRTWNTAQGKLQSDPGKT